MRLETFFEKFELFADAPDATAKMRILVQQLAVQGRLVAQCTEDEPADALAKTIANDRAAFVKARSLARQRVFDPITDDQCPFDLPPGWIWTRLGNICRAQAGFAFESAAFVQGDSGVPMIRIRDITSDHTQVNYLGKYREEFLVDTGDYLIGMDGNFTVAKWRGPRALLNQRVSRLQWYSTHLEPSFFAISAQHRFAELQGKKAYTTVDHLSSKQIEDAIVPLPPLTEQKRIVAKVDELMALCDRLEAQQQERQTRHTALARASLSRFAEAPTSTNLGFLFHEAYDIDPADLRKSILTLAVQGKLVPQDPNDEPAQELLGLVGRHRARLLASDSRRKTKPCRHFSSDEAPYDLPDTWIWTMLGEITDVGTGSTPSRTEPSYWAGGSIPWITSGSTSHSSISEGDEFVTPAAVKAHRLRVYPEGTLLVALYGQGKTRGQVTTLKIAATINQACAAICTLDGVPQMQGYLKLLLEKQYDEMRLLAAGGAQPNLNVRKIKEVIVPLPPLAEQRRIVAKVEQLMALVNHLETLLAESRTAAANLLEAVVSELTAQKLKHR